MSIKSILKNILVLIISVFILPYLSCHSTIILMITTSVLVVGLFIILIDSNNDIAVTSIALTMPTIIIIAIAILSFSKTAKLGEYKIHNIELLERTHTVCGLTQSNEIRCADVGSDDFINIKYLLKGNPKYQLTFIDYKISKPCGALSEYYTKIKELK